MTKKKPRADLLMVALTAPPMFLINSEAAYVQLGLPRHVEALYPHMEAEEFIEMCGELTIAQVSAEEWEEVELPLCLCVAMNREHVEESLQEEEPPATMVVH